jgi:GAF domain-containing protein
MSAALVYPETLIQQTLKTRKIHLVSDAELEPDAKELLHQGIRSWIAAPLLAGDEVVGLLTVSHNQPQAFHTEDIDFIRPVCAQIAVAIQMLACLNKPNGA